MATRIRRLPERPTREERAQWMGHVDRKYRTTEEWYESHDPYYLANVASATDTIMLLLDNLSEKRLFSPNSLPNHRLNIIENPIKNNELDVKIG